jgi:peptidoglycan/xylan/chitin deacetylase (PgdA/CDA1 family)
VTGSEKLVALMGWCIKRRIRMKKFVSMGLRLVNHFNRANVAVLKYHSIQDQPDLFDDTISPSTIVPTSAFRIHMEILAKNYDPITMDDLLRYAEGEGELPKRPVAVTFDDGYRDNFAIAGPILDEMGIRATIYVTTGSVEKKHPPWFVRVRHAVWTTRKEECVGLTQEVLRFRDRDDRVATVRLLSKRCARLVGEELDQEVQLIEDVLEVDPFVPSERLMMNWEEIRQMSHTGHVIGSHTISHPNVAHLEDGKMRWELEESKRIIEEEIDRPVSHFSYPNPALVPHLTKSTAAALRKGGYRTAVLSTHGKMHINGDLYSIKRTWAPPDREQLIWNIEKTLFG